MYLHTQTSIYVYINIYRYIFVYIYICISIKIYMYIYVYIYMYIYTYIYIYICTYIYVYVYVNVYMCVYIYMYACIHLHVYMYIYTTLPLLPCGDATHQVGGAPSSTDTGGRGRPEADTDGGPAAAVPKNESGETKTKLNGFWSATQTRATYGGLCGMPACGQAVGSGVCDTPELWRGAAGLCARVRACAGGLTLILIPEGGGAPG